ncbi:YciI family protein [Chitinophaga qingshengii]|uniref:Transcription initiation protein n=1 Tax=Chitinophaga qingshengii TaxID=1569794 RepID=A0ABR7TS97_9BACT|nr:YciI family protein [Chitinophaga qingshengii]MBC9932895.1 transcription initiation protein [Chitinophaga qingshengii]
MKNFLLLFRADSTQAAKRSPEEMQASTKKWMDWIGSIAAQNKLVDRGNRLEHTGKVLRGNNVVTDGPFTEIKETLGGYTMVSAGSLEEAVEMANGCPILQMGGSVEVREISVL